MRPTRRRLLATAATVSVAGCLGNGSGASQDDPTATATDSATPTDTATETPTDSPVPTTTIEVRTDDEHGDILVGPAGLTLYMFDQDTQGADESACSGGCADAWPPLTAPGDLEAGDGVTADLSTFERDGDGRQVTAGGWPLYYFADDGEPGDAMGQGVGGTWWVLGPDGTPLRSESTPTPTPTSTETESGGGGNGGDGYDY